MESLDSIVF